MVNLEIECIEIADQMPTECQPNANRTLTEGCSKANIQKSFEITKIETNLPPFISNF